MTADRLVSIAAGTWLDVEPADAVSIAASVGWPAVGLWFDPATWTDSTTREVRRRLDDTGVVALDMEPIILGDDPAADVATGSRLIDAAAGVGARWVLVASREADEASAADRFGILCDRAASSGVTLVLEFLPIFGIRTLEAALDVVQSAGRSNSGVLVDALHLARSGASPADLAAVDRGLLPYLQLCDAPAEPTDPSIRGLLGEALGGRLLLGDGGLPIRELLAAVPAVPISFELRSERLLADHPDPAARAAALLDNWRRFDATS